jgi:hypothetical protein
MYRSVVDASPQELAFEFDPLRPLHAHDGSSLAWQEYPYKQVVIDKLCNKYTKPKLSQEAAAGALLIARGDFGRAEFEVDQHFNHEQASSEDASGNIGWTHLEGRFHSEREAFRRAKKDFIKSERVKAAAKLDGIAKRKQEEEDRVNYLAWRQRQIIKRYDNGSKYDGEGVKENGVLVPHGHGTLWVPQKESVTGGERGDVKRVPQYVGEWKNGFMHGKGTYYWRNGDSWEGNFCRDDLQGKGIFTSGSGEAGEVDTSRLPMPKEQRVRYYDASQHICWGDELVRGCRLRVYENRRYGDPLVAIVRRHNVHLEQETEYGIVSYDGKRDVYLVRKGESEQTKWISLANTNFRVVASRPVARFEPSE